MEKCVLVLAKVGPLKYFWFLHHAKDIIVNGNGYIKYQFQLQFNICHVLDFWGSQKG
jgi:hypothetical protein